MTPGVVEQFCFNNMLPVSVIGAGVGGLVSALHNDTIITFSSVIKRLVISLFVGFIMYFSIYDYAISPSRKLVLISLSGYVSIELLQKIQKMSDSFLQFIGRIAGGGKS